MQTTTETLNNEKANANISNDIDNITDNNTKQDFISELNQEQKQAVTTTQGALLVLSGAGTGKTKVLTCRLAYIISCGFASPWECLAVTFTNKAAAEMRQRLNECLGSYCANQLWLGTFHSIALKMLRRFAGEIGYQNNFEILDDSGQKTLIKQLMQADGIDTKKYTPDSVASVINGWKDKGFLPDSVLSSSKQDFLSGKILALYHTYQARLKSLNMMDFGDLLLLSFHLLQSVPEVLQKYQNQFHYIMVDEYQDTNTIQYMWLRLLAKGHNNLCCVGDDDQSIYSWRGAEINNILQFDKDFKEAKTIRLVQNYRSGSAILGAASGLISHNYNRLGKDLVVAEKRQDNGAKVNICGLWDWKQEASKAVGIIQQARQNDISYKDMAVLVRTGVQMREFEEAFIANSIPYQVIGGNKFYEREEIKDAIAYLKVCSSSSDDIALARIINKPRRSIGDTTVSIIKDYALEHNVPLFKAAEELCHTIPSVLKPAARNSVSSFIDSVYKWQSLLNDMPIYLALETILNESGYIDMWKGCNSPEAEGKLENVNELLGLIQEEFVTVSDFLEHIALVSDTDDLSQDDKVNIMTLHSAKGLEFDTVILAGWEEGLFPHQRSLDEAKEQGLEEERRLAYVGITRAKRNLWITFASSRRVYNEWQNNAPSRFLEEIPEEYINGAGKINKAKTFPDFNEKISWSSYNPVQKMQQTTKYYNNATKNKNSTYRAGGFKVGQQVRHSTFGLGVIAKIDGDKLEILFEDIGRKHILEGFVEAV